MISRPFVSDDNLWGKGKYRCRIKIKPAYIIDKKNKIPLYLILGYIDNKKNYVIEPYLHNLLFIKLSNNQSKILFSILNENKKENEKRL